jgi:hypothetical protein
MRNWITLLAASAGLTMLAPACDEASSEPRTVEFVASPTGSVLGEYRAMLLVYYAGEEDPSQCNALAYNRVAFPFGHFADQPMRIDTDNRPGGCTQQFVLYDPDDALPDLQITTQLAPQPGFDNGQCSNLGPQIIQHTQENMIQNMPWSAPIRIDTDDRPGACVQTFAIHGRPELGLDVLAEPDGDPGQCPNNPTTAAIEGHPASIVLDTDSRPGGCRVNLRLRNL